MHQEQGPVQPAVRGASKPGRSCGHIMLLPPDWLTIIASDLSMALLNMAGNAAIGMIVIVATVRAVGYLTFVASLSSVLVATRYRVLPSANTSYRLSPPLHDFATLCSATHRHSRLYPAGGTVAT